MSRMVKPVGAFVLTVLMGIGLVGCGGGGSSSGGNNQAVTTVTTVTTVTGVVTDPAISGAKVRLDNRDGQALAQIAISDELGHFSFAGISLTQLIDSVITASGGRDTVTGVDFTGLYLKGRFNPDAAAQFITPLTTLIVEDMQANNRDYASAKAAVAQSLGIDEALLELDPAGNADIQKITLQLSHLAAALRTSGGFAELQALVAQHGQDWTAMGDELAANPDLSDAVKNQVAEALDVLNALTALEIDNAAELLDAANRISMINGVQKFLKTALQYDPAPGSDGAANIVKLAEALWQANGKKGLPSDSAKFANMVRYIFNVAGIDSEDLDDANWQLLPEHLSNIQRIAELDVIDRSIALAANEFLTTSEQKRAYFYASDLAPAYQALQLFKGVLDDNITDPIFVEVAANYAARGMKEEAEVILNSQIFMPQHQVSGLVKAGAALAQLDRVSEAQVLWTKAEAKLDAYMTGKGYENLNADDASLYLEFSTAYRAAGLIDEATALLVPVDAFITANSGTFTTAFGRMGTAFSTRANTLIEVAEENDFSAKTVAEALDAVDFYARILDGYGIQTATTSCGNHYMLKVLGYTGLASYYARLSMASKVQETINKFVDLRSTHACTSQRTDVYLRQLVDEYAYLNNINGFVEMVNNTAVNAAQKTTALNSAKLYLAIEKAKAGDVAAAIADVVALYPDDSDADDLEDRLEMLTNAGISHSSVNAKLALRLLQDGFIEEGAEVLDAAWNIVNSATFINGQATNGRQLTNWGCSKVALLTWQYVDQSSGEQRLQQCKTIVENFAELETSTTKEISLAWAWLSSDALQMGVDSIAAGAYREAIAYADLLTGDDAISAIGTAVSNTLSKGLLNTGVSFTEVLAPMNNRENAFKALADAAVTQDELYAAANVARSLVYNYGLLVNGLQKTLSHQGSYSAYSEDLRSAKQAASNAALAGQALIQQVSNDDQRERFYCFLLGDAGCASSIENAQVFDTSIALLDAMHGVQSTQDINNYRLVIARHILRQDAFSGISGASIDFDNDGVVDFYDANITADEIAEAGVILDDDVDGDGTDDALDSTPFFCEVCAD